METGKWENMGKYGGNRKTQFKIQGNGKSFLEAAPGKLRKAGKA